MNTYLEGIGIPVIMLMVYGTIEILKLILGTDSDIKRFYPLISGGLGILCALVMCMGDPGVVGADNIISAALIGLCSGLSATGTNQMVKKIIQNALPGESEDAGEEDTELQNETNTFVTNTVTNTVQPVPPSGISSTAGSAATKPQTPPEEKKEIYNPNSYDNSDDFDCDYFCDMDGNVPNRSGIGSYEYCRDCCCDCCCGCEYDENLVRYQSDTDKKPDSKTGEEAKAATKTEQKNNSAAIITDESCDEADGEVSEPEVKDLKEAYDYSENDNATDLLAKDH